MLFVCFRQFIRDAVRVKAHQRKRLTERDCHLFCLFVCFSHENSEVERTDVRQCGNIERRDNDYAFLITIDSFEKQYPHTHSIKNTSVFIYF